MSEIIQSISFQENKISWIQASLNKTRINITHLTESPSPFVINYDNIKKASTSLQIANHLNTIASRHDISLDNVRFLLSARFMIVKKVLLDQSVPPDQSKEFIKAEYSQILTEPFEDYIIYLPDHSRKSDNLTEVLTIGLKKDSFYFFRRIAEEAKFPLAQISINCLTVSDLFKALFPNQIGQSLLVNFTERGFELIVCDEKHFLTFLFKPYSKSLQSIGQLDDEEVLSGFNQLIEEIQMPNSLDEPLYSISKIYVYGIYFKAQWSELLEGQVNVPVQVFDPIGSKEWRIIVDDPSFDPKDSFRFVEPLSNLL